jgi:hypothetical protein
MPNTYNSANNKYKTTYNTCNLTNNTYKSMYNAYNLANNTYYIAFIFMIPT